MTRNTKIAETLNLPEMDDLLEEIDVEEEVNQAVLNSTLALAEQASRTVDIQSGDGHADAMDDIHKQTLQHAKDLMDLGYNVDQRSAATIFEKSTMMYRAALDAKNSKRDMQLKAMKLMLDQRKIEIEEKRLQHELGEQIYDADATATIVEDRNDMIKRIRDQNIK